MLRLELIKILTNNVGGMIIEVELEPERAKLKKSGQQPPYRSVCFTELLHGLQRRLFETQTRFIFDEAAKLGEIKKSNEKGRANYRRFLEEMTWCQS